MAGDATGAWGMQHVGRFLAELVDLICNRCIDSRKVFDLTMRLDQAAQA